jgi:hypothetical protein
MEKWLLVSMLGAMNGAVLRRGDRSSVCWLGLRHAVVLGAFAELEVQIARPKLLLHSCVQSMMQHSSHARCMPFAAAGDRPRSVTGEHLTAAASQVVLHIARQGLLL